jgi:glycosyltransferase involved in cell wall biosynthesis
MQQILLAHRRSLREKIVVIPPAVTLSTDRGEVPLPPLTPRPWIYFPASPAPHKNHDVLLRAFQSLLERGRRASLLLTIRADDLDLDSISPNTRANVHFLGTLSHADARAVLCMSDVMVFPSLMESFGLPLIEALDAGIPVAAPDLPYAREVLGDAGKYFTPTDATDLAAALEMLIDDPASAEQLVRAGRQRLRRYDPSTIGERYAELVEGVVFPGHSGPRRMS